MSVINLWSNLLDDTAMKALDTGRRPVSLRQRRDAMQVLLLRLLQLMLMTLRADASNSP